MEVDYGRSGFAEPCILENVDRSFNASQNTGLLGLLLFTTMKRSTAFHFTRGHLLLRDADRLETTFKNECTPQDTVIRIGLKV